MVIKKKFRFLFLFTVIASIVTYGFYSINFIEDSFLKGLVFLGLLEMGFIALIMGMAFAKERNDSVEYFQVTKRNLIGYVILVVLSIGAWEWLYQIHVINKYSIFLLLAFMYGFFIGSYNILIYLIRDSNN